MKNRKLSNARFSGWYQGQVTRDIKGFEGLSLKDMAKESRQQIRTFKELFKTYDEVGYFHGLCGELSLTFSGKPATEGRGRVEAVTVVFKEV